MLDAASCCFQLHQSWAPTKQAPLTLLTSWNSQGVTSDDGSGVRGREPTGEPGLLLMLLPKVLLTELLRLRVLRAAECVDSTP